MMQPAGADGKPVPSSSRVLSESELDRLYDLGVPCEHCGRSNDWLVSQTPEGRVIAECNDCDQCTTVVPMAVVERLLGASGRH